MNDLKAIEKLSESLKFKTISYIERDKIDFAEYTRFLDFLEMSFPNTYQNLEKTVINEYSVVLKWNGKNSDCKKSVLFLAHYDVVPVENEDKWEHEPFSGLICDGFIWGRGTMDDKGSLMAILESIESLIERGHTPEDDIYIAFGHDEEIGGKDGASEIAKFFKQNDISFEYALDEGLLVTKGIMPNIVKPVSFVGLAEKGYLSLELVAKHSGGHSSMPHSRCAISILAKAITLLKKEKFKAKIHSVIENMLKTISAEMSIIHRFIFKNFWLTRSLVTSAISRKNTTNALIRTTVAPTILTGGEKENVIPKEARAVINLRILPGDSIKSVIFHIKKVLKSLPIEVNILNNVNFDPSKISSENSKGYNLIKMGIENIYPESIVVPSIALAGTDSRHYADLCSDIYRFIPIEITKKDSERIHGENEKISEKTYKKMIDFYLFIMEKI